jgi:hypothetical protein
MRTLKITLSILALLVGAVATAMTAGMFNVPPQIIGIVMAGAGLISVLGIQPFALTAAVSRVLSAGSVLLAALQGWHASVVTTQSNGHPWIWAAVGIAGVLMGVLGRSPIAHVPPTAADGPLISPASKLDRPPPGDSTVTPLDRPPSGPSAKT